MFVLKNSLMFGAVCCALWTSLMIASDLSDTVRASSIASSDARALSPGSSGPVTSNPVRPRAGRIRTREERDAQDFDWMLYSDSQDYQRERAEECVERCRWIFKHSSESQQDAFSWRIEQCKQKYAQESDEDLRKILIEFARCCEIDDEKSVTFLVNSCLSKLPEIVQQNIYNQIVFADCTDMDGFAYNDDKNDCSIRVVKAQESEFLAVMPIVLPSKRMHQEVRYSANYEQASFEHKRGYVNLVFELLCSASGAHALHLSHVAEEHKEFCRQSQRDDASCAEKLSQLRMQFHACQLKRAKLCAFCTLINEQDFDAATVLLSDLADPEVPQRILSEFLPMIDRKAFSALRFSRFS